jgi:hypothetical protein
LLLQHYFQRLNVSQAFPFVLTSNKNHAEKM